MKPRLSICMATMNRAAFLPETLSALCPQLGADVELVIVDGGSTDDTPAVVARYQQGCPSLRYIRLDRPGGVDQDFDRAVEFATGEYSWLMSDDDILKPGGVAAVLKQLDLGYALIVVNAEVRDATLARLLEANRLNRQEDDVYPPAEMARLFVDTGRFLTFIGGVVIRRSVWQARRPEEFYGSLFIHVGVIFREPLPAPALVIAEPLVVIRLGNAQWAPRGFEIWMFKWPELVWSLPMPDEARQAVTPREPWRRVKQAVLYRARGWYSLSEYQRLLAPRIASPLRRALMRTIARAPQPLMNLLCVAYYTVLRHPSRRLLLYALEGPAHYRSLLGRLLWPGSARSGEA